LDCGNFIAALSPLKAVINHHSPKAGEASYSRKTTAGPWEAYRPSRYRTGILIHGFGCALQSRWRCAMPILELTDEQVIDLVRQLPPELQHAALLALAAGAGEARGERMKYAEDQLRRVSADRGLDWDKMAEEEREAFIHDLIHEDRPCGR
jgi:hypothetical protein